MKYRQRKVLRKIKEAYINDDTVVTLNVEAVLDIMPEVEAEGDAVKWVLKKALAFMDKEGTEELEEAVGITVLPKEMEGALKEFGASPLDDDFVPDDAMVYEVAEYIGKKTGLNIEDYDPELYSEFVARAMKKVYGYYDEKGKLKTTPRITKFGFLRGKDFKKIKDDITGMANATNKEESEKFANNIIEKLSQKHEYLKEMGDWEKGLFIQNLYAQAARSTSSVLGGF